MAKRTYGTGNITERSPGVWIVRTSHKRDPATGKRLREAITVRGNRKAAELRLAQLLTGPHAPLTDARNITFGEFARDALARNPRARPATAERYLSLFDRYTSDRLQRAVLADVTPALLNRERDLLSRQPSRQAKDGRALSSKTVTLIMGVWAAALRIATQEGRFAVNPMRGVDPPATTTSERAGRAMTKEEADRVLAAAEDDPRRTALWHVLVTRGLRPSEAMALRWSDLDLEARRLRVERALVSVGGQWTFGPTKTGKPRMVPLTEKLTALLERHRRQQAAERLRAGPSWVDLDLIFGDPAGRIVSADRLKKPWRRLLKAAQVPRFRLYDARHTSHTLALRAGMNVKDVATMHGNSVRMTLAVYTDDSIDLQREVLERMEAGRQDRTPRQA